MKPFLDAGFLVTLLIDTNGSQTAWEIARKLDGPLHLSSLHLLHTESRLQLEVLSETATPSQRALAAQALQNLRWYVDQHVLHAIRLDYEIAIALANQWQRRGEEILPAMLLLWPALAITTGASHFLSFNPRTRRLAKSGGLKLLPDRL